MGDMPKYYWCVETKKDKIYLNADEAQTTSAGDLIFWRKDKDGNNDFQIISFSSGNWIMFFAASCVDGRFLDKYIEHLDSKEQ